LCTAENRKTPTKPLPNDLVYECPEAVPKCPSATGEAEVDGRWSMVDVVRCLLPRCCAHLLVPLPCSLDRLVAPLALDLTLALSLKMSFFTGGIFAVVSMLGANAIRRVPIFSGMRPPAPLAPAPHLMPNLLLS